MKELGRLIALRYAIRRSKKRRKTFESGPHILIVKRTKRGVRLHIEDTDRGGNANITLSPEQVDRLVTRLAAINGGKTALKRARLK